MPILGLAGAAAFLGVLLGLGSAWWVLERAALFGAVEAGVWRGSMSVGAAEADPYTRAVVARVGLLGLTREEAIYFTASGDETGAALREACVYQLSGAAAPAGWWSITLYAADNYLARNADRAASIDQTRTGPGDWTARVASDAQEGHWISSRNAGDGFTLTLRLYQPAPSALSAPERIQAPRIRLLECKDAPA